MNVSELLAWQWFGYSKVHQSRLNLILHIIFVPVFIVSTLSLIYFLIGLSIFDVFASALTMGLAFGAQGIGHSKENIPAEPFTRFGQAIARVFLEQFVTFPRFVFSGGWYRSLTKN